jgi:hypothetical protein
LLVVAQAAPTHPVAAGALVDILSFRRKLLQPEMYIQFQWALVARLDSPVVTELVHQ